ncbi:MAG: phospholipase D-like domain-containing protein, partial [Bacilli bacterium]|nr:phospholipase D-like domain-containing protein [Bacilli bacterium]
FPDLIECLKQAKQFIFIEFFIISEGKQYNAVLDVLKQKAKEGIDVRIIYDDFGCSGYLPANTPRKLAKFGIKCVRFAPLKPIISSIYNNRDHRKIVIIDHQYGYTGGINLADEYANITHPFKYWKDTMIKIEGSAINNLLAIFLKNYDLCVWEVSNYNQYLDYEYPKFKESGYVMPFGDGPGGFDNALIGEQNYINIINYARKTLYISTPYLIPTYPLLSALRNASLRGVDVRIIVPGVPDKKLVYWLGQRHFHFLLSAGIKIYTYTPGFNHMKTCIADGELAFVGTINMDFRSLVHHFECGATLYKNPCLKDIEEDFNEMFKVSNLVPKNFKLNVFKRAICSILKIFTPLF